MPAAVTREALDPTSMPELTEQQGEPVGSPSMAAYTTRPNQKPNGVLA